MLATKNAIVCCFQRSDLAFFQEFFWGAKSIAMLIFIITRKQFNERRFVVNSRYKFYNNIKIDKVVMSKVFRYLLYKDFQACLINSIGWVRPPIFIAVQFFLLFHKFSEVFQGEANRGERIMLT